MTAAYRAKLAERQEWLEEQKKKCVCFAFVLGWDGLGWEARPVCGESETPLGDRPAGRESVGSAAVPAQPVAWKHTASA